MSSCLIWTNALNLEPESFLLDRFDQTKLFINIYQGKNKSISIKLLGYSNIFSSWPMKQSAPKNAIAYK